jgi:hypothetical protein
MNEAGGSNECNQNYSIDQYGTRTVVPTTCILNGDMTPEATTEFNGNTSQVSPAVLHIDY